MSHFEDLGGEVALRRVVDIFVDRVFSDVMIGFIFTGKNRGRLREMEYQLAAEQLGGPVSYSGRSMRSAHAPLPIMGGHFDRRRQILINTLRDCEVPATIQRVWIEHVDALRADVLGADALPLECNHDLQAERGQDEPKGDAS